MIPTADNHLVLSGQVLNRAETRYNPAGLPITRLLLEHRSRQVEAGIPREAHCRIEVLVCGELLQQQLQGIGIGAQVRVQGFLTRADHRQGQDRLVLHAACIESLATHSE
ncbi:MAG TPA: primosomal replication protein N [Candidatus Competibacteraceae bacterium]|nr:primosomal replication protein N [Candidatus Competibacteraceae bacterium]